MSPQRLLARSSSCLCLAPSLSHPCHKPLTLGSPWLLSQPPTRGEREAGSPHPSPGRRRGAPSTGHVHVPVFLAVILEPCLSRRTNTLLLQWFTNCSRRPLRVWILTKHFAITGSWIPSASSACHGLGQLPPAIVALTFH